MEKQNEELLVSEAPAPQIANCVSFNGTITTDIFNLEPTKCGFVLRGPNKEEFPMILLNRSKASVKDLIIKGDKISAVGMLEKYDGDWVIRVVDMFRHPTEDELEKMS